jgi:hypothetical protein
MFEFGWDGEQTMFREIFSNSKIRLDVSSYDARPNWKTCMIQKENSCDVKCISHRDTVFSKMRLELIW